MFSSTFILLSLSASAFATVFTTSPVSSTTFNGGKPATVSWQDDGSAPTLKDFGPAMVSIYVGNAQQQTRLQTITPSVDVATTSTIQFTPDPSIGPNSNNYFIRFESISLKDAKSPQFPALAFSAKFQMSGMTGKFNSTVQAQIDGQSTAPIGGATTAAAGSSGAGAGATPTGSKPASSTVSGSKSSSASTTGATSKPSNGAMSMNDAPARGLLMMAGLMAGVVLF
jgi:hypothetical protein